MFALTAKPQSWLGAAPGAVGSSASAKSSQIQTQDWNILHTILSQQMQIKNPRQALLPSRNPGARRDSGSSGAGEQGQEQGQGWISHPFPEPARTDPPCQSQDNKDSGSQSPSANPPCYSQSVFQVICYKVDISSLFVVPIPSQYSVFLYQTHSMISDFLRTGQRGFFSSKPNLPKHMFCL